jgi:ribose-phosphate pyrophosphokinase
MDTETIRLFALNASRPFAERVAEQLAVPLNEHEERDFEDGEHKSRPLANVRNSDVFVIQSLYSDPQQSVNDKLCRLLFFLGCLKDASAARITAVIPYLAYARKDRKTQTRDPVTTRYLALLFEAVGTDRVVTLDVHNLAAFQNAFRCPTDHLEANGLFVKYFASLAKEAQKITVVSPDVGGMKRAEQFRRSLSRVLNREISVAFMEKARGKGVLTIGRLVGEVAGSFTILIDDLISTGGTLLGAAQACREQGAEQVYAAASHGVFVGKANQILAAEAINKIIVTDTIPPLRLDPELVKDKLMVLTVSELFAQAIKRIHEGGSIVDLLAV